MDRQALQQAADEALVLDVEWETGARRTWLALIDLAVWGDLGSARLGATGRVRKRALDVGEKLRSLAGDRSWIPHPREQLKNALAAALQFGDSLDALTQAAGDLDSGADLDALSANLAQLRQMAAELEPRKLRWAQLLDAQYQDDA